jgi:hypothetical protein
MTVMLGTSLKYFFQHPVRLASALATDPLEARIKFWNRYAEHRERQNPIFRYQAEAGWEERVHCLIGFPLTCRATSDFNARWTAVIAPRQASGIRVGPSGFGSWNDGDAGLARAIWCLVLHLRPRDVVETGVGHGATSRFILEALDRNAAGHLSSIDIPPFDPADGGR